MKLEIVFVNLCAPNKMLVLRVMYSFINKGHTCGNIFRIPSKINQIIYSSAYPSNKVCSMGEREKLQCSG